MFLNHTVLLNISKTLRKHSAFVTMAQQNKISLRTADGVVFEVEPFIANEMKTVKSVIDAADETITTAVPLPNVNSDELTRIIDYCQHHRNGDEKELKDFDEEFVKGLNLNELKELVIAVHYLNMHDLLEFLTQVIADRIQNKSVEFVREYFGVDNDLTPEEEAKYREEHAWAFNGVDDDDDEEEEEEEKKKN